MCAPDIGKKNNKGLSLDTYWQYFLWCPQKDVDCPVIPSKWLIFGEKYLKRILILFKEMEIFYLYNGPGCKTDTAGMEVMALPEHKYWSTAETLTVKARQHITVMRCMGMSIKAHGRNTLKTSKYSQCRPLKAKGRLTNGRPHLPPGSQGRRQFIHYFPLAGLEKLLKPWLYSLPALQYVWLGFAKLSCIHLQKVN